MNETLSSNLEDYLEVIYNWQFLGKQIRAVDISRELGITRASVTESLQKLRKKNLISSEEKSIILTDDGLSKAKKIVSKHAILQIFFEKVLKLPSDEASDNACKIEHVISENAFDKISEFVKNYK